MQRAWRLHCRGMVGLVLRREGWCGWGVGVVVAPDAPARWLVADEWQCRERNMMAEHRVGMPVMAWGDGTACCECLK